MAQKMLPMRKARERLACHFGETCNWLRASRTASGHTWLNGMAILWAKRPLPHASRALFPAHAGLNLHPPD